MSVVAVVRETPTDADEQDGVWKAYFFKDRDRAEKWLYSSGHDLWELEPMILELESWRP